MERRECTPHAMPDRMLDAQRMEKLLGELEGFPPDSEQRDLSSAICVVYPDGKRIDVEGTCEGSVALRRAVRTVLAMIRFFLVGRKHMRS